MRLQEWSSCFRTWSEHEGEMRGIVGESALMILLIMRDVSSSSYIGSASVSGSIERTHNPYSMTFDVPLLKLSLFIHLT